MPDRQALIDLIERIPDEDVPVVRTVLTRFVRGLTIAELRAIAEGATPDPEGLSESESIGFAEAEATLERRRRARGCNSDSRR